MPTADRAGAFTSWRPQARLDQLVMMHVEDEVLVYDEDAHAIHRLNPTSRLIWSLCDGTRTLPDLSRTVSATLGAEVTEAVVRLALSQLAGANLLSSDLPAELHEPRSSRRVMLRRTALAGGVLLPVLASISAPTAAMASSHCLPLASSCSPDGDPCCSGLFCYYNTLRCRPVGCSPNGSFCFRDDACCGQYCVNNICFT